MYEYHFPKADVTSSVVAYAVEMSHFHITDMPKHVVVAAIRRGKDPFVGKLALPGGFLEIGKETLRQAGARELLEETGLETTPERLYLVTEQSRPERDPRGHVIDHVYMVEFPMATLLTAKAGDDAASVEFITFDNNGDYYANEWAFDHAYSLYLALHQVPRFKTHLLV